MTNKERVGFPTIDMQHINDTIVSDAYWQPLGTTLTICILKLKNGFTVTGEAACVCPENFNEAMGKEVALENAKDKIWQLEGYLLQEQMYGTADE